MKLAIYGAMSLALGTYRVLEKLYPDYPVECFLVSSLVNNPSTLAGKPVLELESFAAGLTPLEKKDMQVLIGTPENIHREIVVYLQQHGFENCVCLDSVKLGCLMELYFNKDSRFVSLHDLKVGSEKSTLQVFLAKFYKDKVLQKAVEYPEWTRPLQVGTALTECRVAELCDTMGETISAKNVNYCELTGLYWIWKQLKKKGNLCEETAESYSKAHLKESAEKVAVSAVISDADYYGLFHYRRLLDIREEDLLRLKENNVDAILPYPTLHEPDITEHHARYIKEPDWKAMIQALEELHPEYTAYLLGILQQPYLYNYNIVVAKKQVLEEYCEWLFPILERTEELSEPKGSARADRYIGYLGENLATIYFMKNKNRLNIVHTACKFLV